MEQLPPQRRPHYPPVERLAILEVRAARHWSLAQTAAKFLVTPLTISSWTKFRRQKRRMDEIIDLLNARTGVREERHLTVALYTFPVETWLGKVHGMLNVALKEGIASETLDGYLHIECISLKALPKSGQIDRLLAERARTLDLWHRDGNHVVDAANFVLHPRLRQQVPAPPHTSPRSISERTPTRI